MVYNNLNAAKPIRVSKATADLPQTDVATLFTISGGKVLVSDIIGEVTTIIEAGANNTKLLSNPTVGASVDLCAVLDIAEDAVGTMYGITGTFTDALTETTSGAGTSQTDPVLVAPGTIELSCDASKTGKIKWVLFYIPVDEGAKVV